MIDVFLANAPILAIAIPLLAAFATPVVSMARHNLKNWFALAAVLLSTIAILTIAFQVYTVGPVTYTLGSVDPGIVLPSGYAVPVRIVLNIDAMSVFMAVIASIISLVSVVYSLSFFKKKEHSMEKYYTLLLLMTAGMYGLVFTGDLFNLFVFLEILSIASCGLIAFWVHKGEASEAAFKYLVVSAVAALLLLVAIALLYGQYNALNIATIASMIQFGLIEKVALALMIAAFAMKSGSVPMHMWVPDAYSEAPTPITLMLISATLISMYALFRILFTLFGVTISTSLIAWAIIILGVLSMFIGVTMAIVQKDINRLIAYHSVSQIGYMLLGVGVGLAVLTDPVAMATYGTKALTGGLFHMVNYALYKGLLFLAAGAVIHQVGTRNLNEMGGLAHKMPITTAFFMLGALAIAGIPPLNGFASKFLIYESVYLFNPLLAIIAMVVSILTLASFVKVFHSVFMGPNLTKNKHVKEVPFSMIFGMGILVGLILLFSLFPDVIVSGMVEPATQALLNQPQYITTIMGVPV